MRAASREAAGSGPADPLEAVAARLADALDGAFAASDLDAIVKLTDRLLRVLKVRVLKVPVRPVEAVSGEVTPDDHGEPRPLSIDEQYEQLCAAVRDAEDPES